MAVFKVTSGVGKKRERSNGRIKGAADGVAKKRPSANSRIFVSGVA